MSKLQSHFEEFKKLEAIWDFGKDGEERLMETMIRINLQIK